MTHFGFRGWPDGNFIKAKQPVVAPHSADVQDVSHFFRKDSASQRYDQNPPASPMKQSQDRPTWLQSDRALQSPAHQQQSNYLDPAGPGGPGAIPPTLSPRYDAMEQQRNSPMLPPTLRGEMSSAERRKKMEETRVAQENYSEDRRRKEAYKEAKREDQRKPIQYDDRGRSPMKDMGGPDAYNGYGREPERREGMLDDQERDINRIQSELRQLKEQRAQERAQSEPLTERPYYGQDGRGTNQGAYTDRPEYGQYGRGFDNSPRRNIGDEFPSNTTYHADFDVPFKRPGGRRNLGNPNHEGPFKSYWPFQKAGAGAPLVNKSGQRVTQIQGAMGVVGREESHSAKAQRARNKEMLEVLNKQKEHDRYKKMIEKKRDQEGYVEVAAEMRSMKVGYPKYLPNGWIAQHHLPHTMSHQWEKPDWDQMKSYKESLDEQTAQKEKDTKLAQLEATQQARKHQQTIDTKFGPGIPGGGNRKGRDLRKVNLDRAIHNPQDSGSYYHKVRMGDQDDEAYNKFKPRITTDSSHKNLYEFTEGNPKTEFRGGPPYAQHSGL